MLQTLYDWLRRSPGLEVTAEPSPTHQGAAEIVNIVLSNTIALSSFLVALRAWLGTRPRKPPITFEARGVRVTLTDDSPESMATLERMLRAALDDDD
ncbi:effector-associated constant component EACC1 [Actinoplanes sp. CA-142083]|uniref:effector-associated constant component EACC1 n=1 Tax=Actinoplanes sp. CA-142083 TaxID=3239903 RepID=UPI003D8F46B6